MRRDVAAAILATVLGRASGVTLQDTALDEQWPFGGSGQPPHSGGHGHSHSHHAPHRSSQVSGSTSLAKHVGSDGKAAAASRQPFFQQLSNIEDVQYFGKCRVGGQDLTVLLDSGSFEVVLFGENCRTCGSTPPYRHSQSPSYSKGTHRETITFGSGTVFTDQIYDTVSIGSYSKPHMPIWEVHTANMPVLAQASFQGVLGIGVPGEPLDTARKQLSAIMEQLRTWRAASPKSKIPEFLEQSRKEAEEKVANEEKKFTLFEGLGVSVFSQCLGKTPGSPGWFVVNDHDPNGRTGFTKLGMHGKIEWSLKVRDLALIDSSGREVVVGCRDGCGALLDTGTSLFGFTSDVMTKIVSSLRQFHGNCGDVRSFPDIQIKVNEHTLRFSPDSYVGHLRGLATPELRKIIPNVTAAPLPAGFEVVDEPTTGNTTGNLIHLARESSEMRKKGQRRVKKHCQLMAMDMGDQLTDMGPLLILGMPFFREFYTTFDLDPRDRAIHVARADHSCRPSSTQAMSFHKTHLPMRQVDLSKVQAPRFRVKGGLVQL